MLLFAIICAASAQLTPDAPWGLPSASLQYLSTSSGAQWHVSSALHSLSAPATVPGDLVSDLQRAGIIGDPFYELGWLNTTTPGAQGAPLWDTGNWTFSLAFTPSAPLLAAIAAGGTPLLVLDGVKMAADVALNGVPLGAVQDQFLRYNFELGAVLVPGSNTLSITFGTSRDPRNAEGRFSGASGGWDWGVSQSPPPPPPPAPPHCARPLCVPTPSHPPPTPPPTPLPALHCHQHWGA